jgi:glycosyltransferase involved in cell wall biosynthesis
MKSSPISNRSTLDIAHFTFDIDNRSNSGTARVAREVILSLSSKSQISQTLIHFQDSADDIYRLPRTCELRFKKFALPFASGFFSFLILCLNLRWHGIRFDIAHWHSSRVYPFFFFFPAMKHVVTLHDVNQMLIPDADTLSSITFRRSLRLFQHKMDLIIGVSDHASRNIVRFGGFAQRKVKTLYWGSRFDELVPEKPLGLNVGSGFLLVVSRWQPYKNVHSTVRAYFDLLQQGHEVPVLVLVGKPVNGFDLPLSITPSFNTNSNQLVVLKDLKDAELAFLYDNCLVNIVPSLFEGFGLSVLEAMKRRKFSLCHLDTATREIAGESGMAIDMSDCASIQKAILQIVGDSTLIESLNASAEQRAQEFTWEATSSKLIKMYTVLFDE